MHKEIFDYEINTKKYTSKFKENLNCLYKSSFISSLLIIIIFTTLNAVTTYLFFKKQLSFTNLIAIFITIIYYIPCINTISMSMPMIIHSYGALSAVDNFVKELHKVENKKEDDKNKDNDKNKDKNNDKNKDNSNSIDKDINKDTDKDIINNGCIIINNLNFSYNENNKLFNNFYLTIKNNEKIAIIGKSGNGKSSLIKIIMGYYNVPNNTIYIGDRDINSYDLNNLRKQISYVNQNSKLFNKTILENIQYGNNATNEDVVNLCKKIKIYNIFENLKDGFYTNVGIEGNNLSGGQRQLVHILRCIFQNSKIVILDEPTSAIDKENSLNIVNALKELSKNKTLILITHDEDILSMVDRRIVIKDGKII